MYTTDEEFDSLKWIKCKINSLKGFAIAEIEPITCNTDIKKPLYSGLILYGTDSSGRKRAIEIKVNSFAKLDKNDEILISKANIK